jgi:hypothetical protein
MKDIKELLINESRISSANVHDAILNLLFKYYNKPGVSQEVKDYCDKAREALDTIKR